MLPLFWLVLLVLCSVDTSPKWSLVAGMTNLKPELLLDRLVSVVLWRLPILLLLLLLLLLAIAGAKVPKRLLSLISPWLKKARYFEESVNVAEFALRTDWVLLGNWALLERRDCLLAAIMDAKVGLLLLFGQAWYIQLSSLGLYPWQPIFCCCQ